MAEHESGAHAQHARTARTMQPGLRQYTRDEVADSKTATETLFIIDNIVYDVHKFLDEHPGGHEVLINVAGKDASEEFEDVGHSMDARELMKGYVVGELVDADKVPISKKQYSWEDTAKTSETEASFVNSWKFPVLLGLALTLLYSYIFG